jgi:hypothetical protein
VISLLRGLNAFAPALTPEDLETATGGDRTAADAEQDDVGAHQVSGRRRHRGHDPAASPLTYCGRSARTPDLVKLNKIYTRTGDDGTTGLVDGSRLPKHAARMEAIGAVDEANSAIGLGSLRAGRCACTRRR